MLKNYRWIREQAALRELTEAVMAEFFGNDTNLSKRLIAATNEAQLLLMVQPPNDDLANHPAPVEPSTFALQWSENKPPCEECRYNHCTAETPFGGFLITWKSWKEYDSPTVDETPWGECWQDFATVELAKAACQREFDARLALCGLNQPTPAESGRVERLPDGKPYPTPPAEGELAEPSDEELLRTYGAATRNYCYEGDADDWPRREARAATVAGLRAILAHWGRPVPPPADQFPIATKMPLPSAEGEDLATSLQNYGTWLIEIGYASEQVNTRDMGIKVVRAAALLQQQAAELAILRQVASPVAIPGDAYEIHMGDVMWWRFPIDEPPWLGTPGDSDWPGYHTHFTPCPPVPAPPEERPND